MTRPSLLILGAAALIVAAPLRSQHVWFAEDFSASPPASRWHPASGNWAFTPGSVRLATGAYDQLLASGYYVYDARPWSVEVSLRGPRAGLFFGLEDTSSRALAHMIRLDDGSILTGCFDAAGEFAATGSYALGSPPKGWTLLRVDVDPAHRKYSVSVDGILAGVDTALLFPSGFFGLQGSDGVSEFRSVRLFSDHSPPGPYRARRGSVVRFNHVRFLRAGQNNVTIYNPETKSYQAFDLEGRLLNEQSARPPEPPEPRARRGDLEVEASAAGITITDARDGSMRTVPVRFGQPSAVLIDADTTVYVADAVRRTITAIPPDGNLIRIMEGKSIGGFLAPRGLDFSPSHQIVVADYNRIVFVDRSLRETPALSMVTPSGFAASWSPAAGTRARVRFAADGGVWTDVPAAPDRGTGEARVGIAGLRPATRYTVKFSDALRVIPPSGVFSKGYRIATPPADPAHMLYARLPVLCMVYRSIDYRDRYPSARYPHVPQGRRLTDDDIEYLRQACSFNAEFYYRNSGCRLLLEFDFHVVEAPLRLHEVGDQDPYWLPPNDRVAGDVERAARALGKTPGRYAGVVVPYAWENYPPGRMSVLADSSKTDSVTIRQAYGGGTLGVPAPWKFGVTAGYTSNPFQDRFSRQDWLITHEFHHQLDALLEASGEPGYYHADQPWKMPGRFGEDFDFNAQIIRNAPAGWWLTMKFGSLEQTTDADRDAVPDDDPRLPFDEKRLGSNPRLTDSDADGLTDLAEVMAGTSRGASPNNRDSDSDGLADGADPEPLYAFPPEIPELPPERPFPTTPFATMRGSMGAADLFWAWTDSALWIACDAPRPASLLLQIDATGDGWFHGFDNFQIRIARDTSAAKVVEYYLRDCSSWTDPPRDRKDLLRPEDLNVIASKTGDSSAVRYQTFVLIPRCDAYGLDLRRGALIALRLGLQTSADRWVWEELLERNAMVKVRLK